MVVVDFHSGQKSSYAKDKESLNTYERILNAWIHGGEIETIPGYERILEAIQANSSIVRYMAVRNFSGHLLTWCLIKDGSTFKTKIAEVTLQSGTWGQSFLQNGGNDLEYAETREPSIAVAPDALMFAQGTTVHKFNISGGNVVVGSDLTGLSNVTAIWFDADGENRVYAIEGKNIHCSDAVAGGDCTTFNNNATNEWLQGGKFPSAFTQNATNICVVSNIICAFSPNKIELKQLEEVQENINGQIYSVKKMTHYGTVPNEGTKSFLRLGLWKESVIFVDESAKQLKQLIPVKDSNGLVSTEPIIDDERNFEKLDFSRVSINYVSKFRRMIISTGDRGEVILFDPTKGDFTTASWDVGDVAMDDDGEVFFTDSTDGILARIDEDTVLQEGNMPLVEIITQEYSPSSFFRKLKIKRLALWLEMNPDAEATMHQKIDGGEWKPIDLKLNKIQRTEGSFDSPYQVLGGTYVGGARRKDAPTTVGIVKGKIRAKAKGTTVQYRLRIRAKYKSVLKYWGIPKSSTNSFMKNNTISKAK